MLSTPGKWINDEHYYFGTVAETDIILDATAVHNAIQGSAKNNATYRHGNPRQSREGLLKLLYVYFELF